MFKNTADVEYHNAESATMQADNLSSSPKGLDTRGVVNLKTIALACIGQLVVHNDQTAARSYEQNYLIQFYSAIKHQNNWRSLIENYLLDPQPEDIRLVDLSKQLDLDIIEIVSIAIVLAVEEDPVVGRAIAFVQAPMGGSRPSLGLLQAALENIATTQQATWIAGSIVLGTALRTGILGILNENAPMPEQTLQIPCALALALRNKHFVWSGTTSVLAENSVVLPYSIQQTAKQHALSLNNQLNGVLVIRSPSLREARSVASEIAKHLHLLALFANPDPKFLKGLGVLCLMHKRLPVFEYDLAPSEVQYLPELPGYDGTKIIIIGPDGNIDSHSGSILQWTIPIPDRSERQQLWEKYLGDTDLACRMAENHVQSAGRIMELAQLSQREARLHDRQNPIEEDIRQAAWSAEEGNLGNLAQPITARITDQALVLPNNTREELNYLLLRCKNRENLDDELGITVKARYQMGVRALLIGPSGTGKTLAASWVATKLGLPLYRVDIASVVSKYIGETEKNLATLLAKAEQSEIVLLFDEADSLFGKRTDIKDSNDRHANSQTNYLLQRIEFYKGIVLLTSNSRGRFDSAFMRRLDKVIEFSLPAPEQRRALWQSHLGDQHHLSMKHLNQLAAGSELAGGHIRNAVLSAAVQAKSNSRQILFDDVVIGLESEYRKLGRQIPSELKKISSETRKLIS